MKHLIFSSVALVFVSGPGIVVASCSDEGFGNRLNQNQIENRLSDKRVLAISPSGEEWHQDHCDNGNLFKVGTTASPPKYPGRPSVDPRAYRGTWETSGSGANALVRYNYTVGGNLSFDWSLWSDTAGNTLGRLCWQNPDTSAVVATTDSAPAGLAGEDCTAP